jgi:hypothetical protein
MILKATLITMAAALGLTMGAHAVEKDFNGDGYSDLIWEDVVTGQRGFWYLNTSTIANGVWTPNNFGWIHFPSHTVDTLVDQSPVLPVNWPNNGEVVPAPPASWHIVGVSDFRGDGETDLVWQDSNTGHAEDETNSSSNPSSYP